MAKKLTSSKAREILHDKSVHGKPLTAKQRRYFGYIAGGGTPKAQGGLTTQPTTADSLAVYNAQLAQNAYYDKFNNYFKKNYERYSNLSPGNFREIWGETIRRTPSESLETLRRNFETANYAPSYVDDIKKLHGVSTNEAKKIIARAIDKTKQLNTNPNIVYYQDLVTPAIDPAAPFSAVDYRIVPQGAIHRKPGPYNGVNFPGNNVTTFYYDPLEVKPWHMKTEPERQEWLRRHPKQKQIQPKPKPVTKPKQTTTTQPQPKPVVTQQVADTTTPAAKPTPKPVETKSEVNPVEYYGSLEGWPMYINQTFVGVRQRDGKNVLIQPEHFQAMGLNANNPNTTGAREYILAELAKQSQAVKKQTGGVISPLDPDKEWLKNWYNKRKIADPYIQEAFELDRPDYMKRMQNWPAIQTVDSVDEDPHVTGTYEPFLNKVYLQKNALPTTKLHELSHHVDYFPSNMLTLHEQMVKQELLPREQTQGVYRNKYDYFSDPGEIHSRIMVLRKLAGFKPDETITSEKLNKFLKLNPIYNDNVNDLLNMVNGEEGLLNLLNFMAKDKGQKAPYVAKSRIQGKGLFTGKDYKKGEMIGLAHENDQPANYIGKFQNHSEQPTAESVKLGNQRFLVAKKGLKPGQEITTNYRMQPELEQPEDFMQAQAGLELSDKEKEKQIRGALTNLYENKPMGPFTDDPQAQAAYSKELAESVESGRNWLQDWYTKRAQLPQFKYSATARARNLSNPQPYITVPENVLGNVAAATLPQKVRTPLMFAGYGENPSYTAPYVALHELTHRQDVLFPQRFLGKEGKKRRSLLEMPTSEQTGMDMSKLQWLEGDVEPNAVLSWWRKENKIDPTKEVTADEVSKIMEYYQNLPSREGITEEQKKESWKNRKEYQKAHGDYHIKALWDRFGRDPQKFADYHNQTVMAGPKGSSLAQAGLQVPITDATYVAKQPIPKIRVTPTRQEILQQAAMDYARQPKATVGPAPKRRNALVEAAVRNAYPVTAAKYQKEQGYVPQNFEKGPINPLDYAVATVNPFNWGYEFTQAPRYFDEGNYVGGVLATAGALPIIGGAFQAAKNVMPVLKSLKGVRSAKPVYQDLTFRSPYTNEIVYQLDPVDYNNFATKADYNQAVKDFNYYVSKWKEANKPKPVTTSTKGSQTSATESAYESFLPQLNPEQKSALLRDVMAKQTQAGQEASSKMVEQASKFRSKLNNPGSSVAFKNLDDLDKEEYIRTMLEYEDPNILKEAGLTDEEIYKIIDSYSLKNPFADLGENRFWQLSEALHERAKSYAAFDKEFFNKYYKQGRLSPSKILADWGTHPHHGGVTEIQDIRQYFNQFSDKDFKRFFSQQMESHGLDPKNPVDVEYFKMYRTRDMLLDFLGASGIKGKFDFNIFPGNAPTSNLFEGISPNRYGGTIPKAKGGMGVIADNGKNIVMPQDGMVQHAQSPDYEGLGYSNKGYKYNSAWGGRWQAGGTFLQPTSPKLPKGYAGPVTEPSTERAISIGGENGEPAYLIPTFKYGRLLTDEDAKVEFRRTGEHLGGPFKTWQEAEEFGKIRHQYVEKGQDVPSPIRTRSKYAMGGSLPGASGMMYARTGQDWKPKNISQAGSVIEDNNEIPTVKDHGDYNLDGEWVPDYKAIAKEARAKNSKVVMTESGALVTFDNNWNIIEYKEKETNREQTDTEEMQYGGFINPYEEEEDDNEKDNEKEEKVIDFNPLITEYTIPVAQTEENDFIPLFQPVRQADYTIEYMPQVEGPKEEKVVTQAPAQEVIEPVPQQVTTDTMPSTTRTLYGSPGVKYNPSLSPELTQVLSSKSKYDPNETFEYMVAKVANEQGLDPRFLWASSYVEGMNQAATRPDIISKSYSKYLKNNPSVQNKYPVDGFYFYGLDNFGSVYPELVKRGYLPKDFDFKPYPATNELKQPVTTGAFKNNSDALRAKAAFLKYEGDGVKAYADKLGVKLNPNEFYFITMAAYNGGPGAAKKILREVKARGITPLQYIQEDHSSWQVYRNVLPRYKIMYKVVDRFQAGGEVKSEQDTGQLKKLDQLLNFTNYNDEQPL